jgi:nickel-dependent lactate racemase
MTTLTFGQSTRFELALDDFTLLAAQCVEHPPVADPARATRSALADPIGYPALALATVPGDRVAVAIDLGVPQMASILCGAVAALMDAGVSPAMITIVSAGAVENRDELVHDLAAMGAGAVRFELHDPLDEQALAMVGVTHRGEPLRLNRTLAEADFVLPIGVGRLADDDRDAGQKFGGLFPQFSSREAAQRARLQAASESAKDHRRRTAEINEAGWLLGVGMTVSVVPGAAGGVAAVLAGDPEAVAQFSTEQTRAVWERRVERQADLVIAALAGDQREQTWENVARALTKAGTLIEPGGAIVLCTELDELPDGPMNLLLEAVDFGDVQRELAREDAAEAHAAIVLAQALETGPIYLRSRLASDIVESLGMTPIEDDEELSRLAAGRDHCVLIEEAQRLVPRLHLRNEL